MGSPPRASNPLEDKKTSSQAYPTITVDASPEQGRKHSIPGASSSLTQRLIDRGVSVPSFPNWEQGKELSSSHEFDSSKYYGLSPFVSTSYQPSQQAGTKQDGRYMSLRQRYERESTRRSHSDVEEEEEEEMGKPVHHAAHGHHHHDDSDIEMSDDDLEKPAITRKKRDSIMIRHKDDTPPSSMDRFNQILAMKGCTTTSNNGMPKTPSSTAAAHQSTPLVAPTPAQLPFTPSTTQMIASSSPPRAALPTLASIAPETTAFKPKPPRRHLLQTPVFEVINSNTVKDRYLFLFNDLLLICKPIMDENIIVGNSHLTGGGDKGAEHRYRFRPNQTSLFQVKNIVELSKLTVYITQEDQTRLTGAVSPPVVTTPPPPATPRKIHPVLTTALRKFKQHAEDGIRFLIEKHILAHDPISIANFLFKTPDLNRRQLGYYLGNRQYGDVYDAFLDCFRLVGLRLDEALRILLTTFRLPSKWETLEYIIERFAKKWHDANQNVVKFHEDMVVKVVVAMLFLNAEAWYDADGESDVFWYARKIKEENDRQRLVRRATTIDHRKSPAAASSAMMYSASSLASLASSSIPSSEQLTTRPIGQAGSHQQNSPPSGSVPMMRASTVVGTQHHPSQQHLHRDLHQLHLQQLQHQHGGISSGSGSGATHARDSMIAIGPLHHIMTLRHENGSKVPTLQEFLDRWMHYDQYELVPREFMEDMYRSIIAERLETGWDNKNGHHKMSNGKHPHRHQKNGKHDDEIPEEDEIDNDEDEKIITVTPHRLPTRLIKGVPSTAITLSIPQPDPGLQIKLRGQDLIIEPNLLDFSSNPTQSFTITGNTLGRTSLMFIKTGSNAGNYISPSLARTKTLVVERPFMRYTFQVAFSHTDIRAVKAAAMQAAKAAARQKQQQQQQHQNQQQQQQQQHYSQPWQEASASSRLSALLTRPNALAANKRPVSIMDEIIITPENPEKHVQGSSNSITGTSPTSYGAPTVDPTTKTIMVKRRYLFSVETEQEKMAWLAHLEKLCGCVVIHGADTTTKGGSTKQQSYRGASQDLQHSAEERVALQVLKESLLADEVKKGTASVAMRTTAAAAAAAAANSSSPSNASPITTKDDEATSSITPASPTKEQRNLHRRQTSNDQPDDPNSDNRKSLLALSGGSTNVVTKRGYDIIKLVVQNSMVPFMLGFLRSHIQE